MKVVVAVDSFKGSMTSMEAGMAVKAGILAAKKDAEVIVKPLADGGEGTTDALIEGLKGERVDVTVTGPYHEPVQAYYGYLRESNTAVMEMATAAGITLSDKKDPMTATTCGVGELILHAISRGIRNFIIGIGGSATNDGGVGMLKALGYRFLDEKGEDAGEGGQALAKIVSVEISDKKQLLSQCNFRIACDVTNPLCGSHDTFSFFCCIFFVNFLFVTAPKATVAALTVTNSEIPTLDSKWMSINECICYFLPGNLINSLNRCSCDLHRYCTLLLTITFLVQKTNCLILIHCQNNGYFFLSIICRKEF